MLKLAHRKAATFKCPEHPRHNYAENATSTNCSPCMSIAAVRACESELNKAEANARRAINLSDRSTAKGGRA